MCALLITLHGLFGNVTAVHPVIPDSCLSMHHIPHHGFALQKLQPVSSFLLLFIWVRLSVLQSSKANCLHKNDNIICSWCCWIRLCYDKENVVGPECLSLSAAVDNYMHNQFFSCCYMGKFVLFYLFHFLGIFCSLSLSLSANLSFTLSWWTVYRALKGSTSRIHLQNLPIHLHLLLHICFHSLRLELILLNLTNTCGYIWYIFLFFLLVFAEITAILWVCVYMC